MIKNYSNMSEEQLFLLIKKSKKEAKRAFEEVYIRYGNHIYNYCRKILKNRESVDDIYQETFVRFYESVTKFKTVGNIKGLLVTIARNLCLNENAKVGNNTIPIDDNLYKFEDESLDNLELSEILHKTVDLLPDIYKEVIVMKEFMDLTYEEIAKALGESTTVIRMRLHRGRKQLKEMMLTYVEDFNKVWN